MKKISFKDICKLKAGINLHVSEKYTHILNFVEGDYLLIYANNADKDRYCVFQDSKSMEFITIPANDAQFLDYYELG